MDAISRLLQPRSVAVIGASADPTKTAGRPVAYLQKHGFAGAHPAGQPQGRPHRRPDLLPRHRLAAGGARCRHRAARRRACPPGGARPGRARHGRRHRAGQRLHRDRRRRRAPPAPADRSRRLDAHPRPQHHRPGEPDRQDRAVGHRRAGDGPLPGRRHRRGVAKRRHPRLAAVACRGARHRPVQADLHQQRSRPGTGRLHRPPGRRRGHQGHRAVCRDGAQPGRSSAPRR